MTTLHMSHTYETDTGQVRISPPDVTVLNSVGRRERARMLEQYVREELGRILGIAPQYVDTTGRPMGCLGIGSISGIELQYRMESVLGVDLNLQRLLLANSAQELIDCLVGQFGPDAHLHGAPVPA
ncbi:acyl carrier protein [Streptomyces sp. NPDC058279]|uniref:acyl carrier protein n=1 Tax=Streptomyces sp. NPDC058279 TaxID=3346418 RepID=UPI0036F042DC